MHHISIYAGPPPPACQMAEEAVPNEHPFVGGQEVDAWDCALAPRLYLAREGCRLLKVGLAFGRGPRAFCLPCLPLALGAPPVWESRLLKVGLAFGRGESSLERKGGHREPSACLVFGGPLMPRRCVRAACCCCAVHQRLGEA